MQHAFGMAVPEPVAEMCQLPRSAVLVHDAQVGILAHVQDRTTVVSQIRRVVEAARSAGVPVHYVRHVSVPPSHMGVGALRAATAWQRVARAEDVRSSFPSEAGHAQLVDDRRSRGCVVGAHRRSRRIGVFRAVRVFAAGTWRRETLG
jgi:biuret amidohydrolase